MAERTQRTWLAGSREFQKRNGIPVIFSIGDQAPRRRRALARGRESSRVWLRRAAGSPVSTSGIRGAVARGWWPPGGSASGAKHVRKPFGVMEFTAAPVAVPPTLTIFVQNDSVILDELKIPDGIDVSVGYVPTVFHKSNTTIEQQREREAANRDPKRELELAKQKLDEPSLAAMKKIETFLDSRKGRTKR